MVNLVLVSMFEESVVRQVPLFFYIRFHTCPLKNKVQLMWLLHWCRRFVPMLRVLSECFSCPNDGYIISLNYIFPVLWSSFDGFLDNISKHNVCGEVDNPFPPCGGMPLAPVKCWCKPVLSWIVGWAILWYTTDRSLQWAFLTSGPCGCVRVL